MIIPKQVNSIIRNCGILVEGNWEHIHYYINNDSDVPVRVSIALPRFGGRPAPTNEIIASSDEFINGFKVVKTSTGEYAYIEEKSKELLPYRYDAACNFNDYGFAMVGKDGYTTWINKNFEYLSRNGKFVNYEIAKHDKMHAWQEIREFSVGDIPLSRVYDGTDSYATICYMDVNGNIKEFYRYDGTELSSCKSMFRRGANFNSLGFAFEEYDEEILFAKGYYVSLEDIVKVAQNNNWFNQIIDEASKLEEKQKCLVKK